MFYRKQIKNKDNVVLDIFLDSTCVSSYLTFKFSALNRACTICFELQKPQTSSTLFSKFYQGK